MHAQINQIFEGGFELREEALLKVSELVTGRLQEEGGGPLNLKFDVRRSDYALITYSTAQEVLDEENSKASRIEQLHVYSSGVSGDSFDLIFEKGEKTRLIIKSNSRDRALLTASDIREYLKNEVQTRNLAFISKAINHRISFPLVTISAMFAMLISFNGMIKRVALKPPRSATTDAKIDYLYQIRLLTDKSVNDGGFMSNIVVVPIAIVVSSLIFALCWNYFYQADVFLWGREKQRIEKHKDFMGKVFWTVIVGIIVSIVASLLMRSGGIR